MRNKKLNLKNTFSNLSLLLYSQFSLPPPPSGAGGWEMGVHSQFMTCCLCCSFCLRGGLLSFLLLQHVALPMGDNPPETSPIWVLPLGSMNCSSAGSFHGVQVQSFRTDSSSTDSLPGSQGLSENLLQHGPFHGATGSAKSLLQNGLSTQSQTPLGIHLFCGDIKYWVSRNDLNYSPQIEQIFVPL